MASFSLTSSQFLLISFFFVISEAYSGSELVTLSKLEFRSLSESINLTESSFTLMELSTEVESTLYYFHLGLVFNKGTYLLFVFSFPIEPFFLFFQF